MSTLVERRRLQHFQAKAGAAEGEELCDECFHPIRLHGKYGCEVERDRYESGYAPMAVPCGCQAWEHEVLSQELREGER